MLTFCNPSRVFWFCVFGTESKVYDGLVLIHNKIWKTGWYYANCALVSRQVGTGFNKMVFIWKLNFLCLFSKYVLPYALPLFFLRWGRKRWWWEKRGGLSHLKLDLHQQSFNPPLLMLRQAYVPTDYTTLEIDFE